MQLIYRSDDGTNTDYTFSLEVAPDGLFRVYVVSTLAKAFPTELSLVDLCADGERLFVCSHMPLRTEAHARVAAAIWADSLQTYRATGAFPAPEEMVLRNPGNSVYGFLCPAEIGVEQPASPCGDLDAERLFGLLASEVHGQSPSMAVLARRVLHHLARCAPRRPLTLFAVGPTGVGKSRAAQVLADALRTFGGAGAQTYRFLRLDMNEYSEAHRVSQLLGAPPGYAGYGEGTELTDALCSSPFTIVLFDEIDKAHSNVPTTLMNTMDTGRLSQPGGHREHRPIDARRAIFFFTSNLAADSIIADLDSSGAQRSEVVDAVCRRRLRAAGVTPELLGRISSFLVFRALGADARERIVRSTIGRVASEYGLQVGWVAPSVVHHVLERAPGSDFGARPDEYLVDDVLGGLFARAVGAGVDGPITVVGPPFRCISSQGPCYVRSSEEVSSCI